MVYESLWRALRNHLRDGLLHAQADMATMEGAPDIYRAQGSFRTLNEIIAWLEEVEEALAEGRVTDSGEILPPRAPHERLRPQ